MASFAKWIGAIVGWYITRHIWGAVLGYFLGYFAGNFFENKTPNDSRSSNRNSRRRNTNSRGTYGSGSEGYSSANAGNSTNGYSSSYAGSDNHTKDYGNSYNKSEKSTYRTTNPGQREDFLYSLMVLSAHVISADGKIMHSEMEYVREFLRANFDVSVVNRCNDVLLSLFEYKKNNNNAMWQKQILTSCYRMTQTMPEGYRQQLIAFLCEIAKADGKVDKTEVDAIRHIALSLNIDASIVEQMLNMGGDSLEEAYKVLGITPDATDDEVKKAYKRMAQKHHPDLVGNLGEDVRKAAEKKFQEIGNAKDIIYKARGIKK